MPKAYKTKVCAICGKSEDANWARHWKNQHPLTDIRELTPGEVPSDPYDESWLYLIKPLSLREIYESTTKNEDIQSPEVTASNFAMVNPISEGNPQFST
jgi:hypothetical protein